MKKYFVLLAVLAVVFQPSFLLAEEKKAAAPDAKASVGAGTKEEDWDLYEDEDLALEDTEAEAVPAAKPVAKQ